MAQKSNNLVGVTGEYFVCAELGKRGILALLTPKNHEDLEEELSLATEDEAEYETDENRN